MADTGIPMGKSGVQLKAGAVHVHTAVNTRSYHYEFHKGSLILPAATSVLIMRVAVESVKTGEAAPQPPVPSGNAYYASDGWAAMFKDPEGVWMYEALTQASSGYAVLHGPAETAVGDGFYAVSSGGKVNLGWPDITSKIYYNDGIYSDRYYYIAYLYG